MKATAILLVSVAAASVVLAFPAVQQKGVDDDTSSRAATAGSTKPAKPKPLQCAWVTECYFDKGATCGQGMITEMASIAEVAKAIEAKYIGMGYKFATEKQKFGKLDCPAERYSRLLCCDKPQPAAVPAADKSADAGTNGASTDVSGGDKGKDTDSGRSGGGGGTDGGKGGDDGGDDGAGGEGGKGGGGKGKGKGKGGGGRGGGGGGAGDDEGTGKGSGKGGGKGGN
ncbi:hypothetical protein GQ42DRAFT_27664 [Ramicandelaber brevisporus]|nr:hypothetical protein GQ42DRAFT_27664 [Ramicandelaber brevisporus]